MKTIHSLLIGIVLLPLQAVFAADNPAPNQATDKSLYERLGGVFAIAAVVDHFSDAVVKNQIVGKTSRRVRICQFFKRRPFER